MPIRILSLIIFLLIQSADSFAYVRSRLTTPPCDGPVGVFWDLNESGTPQANISGGRVLYRLHPVGSDDVIDGSDLEAVEAGFRGWERVGDAIIGFQRDADIVGSPAVGFDDTNVVFWAESSTLLGGGIDITGALAVTFGTSGCSGSRTGEILDADIVFNGVQQQWTSDPESNPMFFDIESVATHEIGHLLGLGHSPVGFSTMFPRVQAGNRLTRSLEMDDRLGVAVIYPGPGFAGSTGSVMGTLTAGGVPVFGGHVVAVDGAGGVAAGALSDPAGDYRIDGLSPGNYSVFAEPLDPSGSQVMFSEQNLGGFYTGLDIDFRTTADSVVSVSAGGTTPHPIAAGAGAGPLDIFLVGGSTKGGFFSNSPAFLSPGDSGETVGVAGPGIPTSGTPLSISGSGITVTLTEFGTVGTQPAIQLTVDVGAGAAAGGRNLIVTDGVNSTVAAGHLEIIGLLLIDADPAAAIQGDSLSVQVNGSGFDPGVALDFGADITITGTSFQSPAEILADLSLDPDARLGSREVIATNPGGQTSSLSSGFGVLFNCARADLDGSGRMDGFDLVAFARTFGGEQSLPGFDPAADFDGDGEIDGMDLALWVPLIGERASTCGP
jgi:hypothetical protein